MLRKFGILLILGVSIFLTAYLPQQSDFYLFIALYTIATGSYVLVIRDINQYSDKVLSYAWLFFSLSLLFTFPNLSNDIYRFFWDGMLVDQGISPYHYLPQELLENGRVEDRALFNLLNSPGYYSVYPPLNQLFYWLSYKLSDGILSFSMFLKGIYLAIMISGVYFTTRLLPVFGYDKKLSFIFFLNPLVLIEGLGNLHIEVVMVSLLAGAFYYYQKVKKGLWLPIFYSLSLGVKLVPLLMSPLFWFNQPNRWRWKFVVQVMLFSIILFFPIFIGSGLSGFTDSLDLYFRKFEFNGGIYYVLRFLGFQLKGYNLIAYLGPALGLITFSSIIGLALKRNERDIQSMVSYSLIAWSIYLILSTTVHPWYIMPLIFLGMLSGKWYPVLWSYLIMLTYINYNPVEYHENLKVVTVEYILLLATIAYEFKWWDKIKSLKG